MPQLKLGWMVVNGPDREREIALGRLEVLLDTYLSVSTPVQVAASELLQIGQNFQREVAARTARNHTTLGRLLGNTAAHPLHSEGGWSAIIQLPKTMSEEEWVTRLVQERGVIVQPGYFFDMASEAYVVVSLITKPEEFEKGISLLSAFAEGS